MLITRGDLGDPRIIALIERHVTRARAESGDPGSAHALDLAGLQSPEVSFWTAWEDGALLGMGALKRLSADHGEVKSMYTDESARHRGIGTAVLRHIIAHASGLGMARLSLETGSMPYFGAARSFYRRYGFVDCAPFADYVLDPNSVFMTLELRKR